MANALDLDGSTSYVDTGSNSNILSSASAVTVSGWINPDTLTGTGAIYSASINNGGNSTGTSRFALERNGSNLQVIIRTDDANSSSIVTTTNALDDRYLVPRYRRGGCRQRYGEHLYQRRLASHFGYSERSRRCIFWHQTSARTAIGSGDDGYVGLFRWGHRRVTQY